MINPKTTVPRVVTAFNSLLFLKRVIHKVLEKVYLKIFGKILAIFVGDMAGKADKNILTVSFGGRLQVNLQ
jgi:hypothetical protein